MHSTANVNGAITPIEAAVVPVLDRGFLYGDSVYEVFRTYDGVPFLYDEHWVRLENSARLIYMSIPLDSEEFLEEIKRTVIASGAADEGVDVYVRYAVTRGEGPISLSPSPDTANRTVVLVKALDSWDPAFYSIGVSLAIPEVRRNPSNALSPNIKGGNYLNNVLGVVQAQALGADDCVLLSQEGLVTEASNSNVFFLIDDVLVTPSQEAGNLKGLTKETVHRACRAEGLDTAERNISVPDLPNATECFITSATREVMPVRSLRLEDGTVLEFPPGGGPVTRKVRQLYSDFVAAYVAQHERRALFRPG